MRRIAGLAVGAALLGLFLALYASQPPRREPEGAAPRPAPAAEAGPVHEAEEGSEQLALQPPAAAALRAAPPEAPREAGAAPNAAALTPEPAPVPLEKLLTWEQARPAPRSLDLGRSPAPETATPPGSGVGDRVYLERRTDEMGPSDRDRKVETTDVGVRVPVAPSVEVRGGVRIESRQDGEAEADDSTPTLGVGVRF